MLLYRQIQKYKNRLVLFKRYWRRSPFIASLLMKVLGNPWRQGDKEWKDTPTPKRYILETKHIVHPFLRKGAPVSCDIHAIVDIPLLSPSELHMKFPRSHQSEANVVKTSILKNRSQHKLICQQLITDNLWNDSAKVMKRFKLCKRSTYFL